MTPRQQKKDRITIEDLRTYVPIYQNGDAALTELSAQDEIEPDRYNLLQNRVVLRELALERICELSAPLMTRETAKLLTNSRLRGKEGVFDSIYWAGIKGMEKGLRKFEVDKIKTSSTNYLFQWFVTYARNELMALEAPFGIPVSRYLKYRKIGAVRSKLTEELERRPLNDEVLDYFHSGRADVKTMNGRVANAGKPSRANRMITLDEVVEQENFVRLYANVILMDDEDSGWEQAQTVDIEAFFETLFGVFTERYNVTNEATAVIMAELGSIEGEERCESLNDDERRKIAQSWYHLMRDLNGPFYKFLTNLSAEEKNHLNAWTVLNRIREQGKSTIARKEWSVLFVNSKVQTL